MRARCNVLNELAAAAAISVRQRWNWVTFCHPATRESSDPVTLFYNELQMSTYVADKRLQWARGLPVFISLFGVCTRFWKVKFNFEDHLLNVNISMTVGRIFENRKISKTGKTRVSHRVKMMTRM